MSQTSKCKGAHRTAKGDRMLVAIQTDPGGEAVRELIARAVELSPTMRSQTPAERVGTMTKLLLSIPKRCPLCGIGGD